MPEVIENIQDVGDAKCESMWVMQNVNQISETERGVTRYVCPYCVP